MFFFDALALIGDEIPFSLSVIGDDASRADALFQRAEQTWQHRIKNWGYLEAGAYWPCLASADFVVSTARHEFFGLAMVEAVAAGCRALLLQRLAYPEVFDGVGSVTFFHEEQGVRTEAEALADCLRNGLREWFKNKGVAGAQQLRLETMHLLHKYTWDTLLPEWDAAVDRLLA